MANNRRTPDKSSAYDYFRTPAITPISHMSQSNSLTQDIADRKLSEHQRYPADLPHDMRSSFRRIFYRVTNRKQAQLALETYEYVYMKDVASELDHKDYLDFVDLFNTYRVGDKPFNQTDPRLFKNATKLAEQTASASSVTASTNDATGTNPRAKKKKKKTHDPIIPVETNCSALLRKAGKLLYIKLRANLKLYVDKQTLSVIEADISVYERNHDLHGEDRLTLGKRYPWKTISRKLVVLCLRNCGGYYFLPLYTTIREKNQSILQWLTTIESIHHNLTEFNSAWGDLARQDTVSRLRDFISDKELAVIKTCLSDKHSELFEQHDHSVHEFFSDSNLTQIRKVLVACDQAKFPRNFDAKTHTPNALKRTLFQLDVITHKNRTIQELQEKLAAAKTQINQLRSSRGRATRTRDGRATRAGDGGVSDTTENKQTRDQSPKDYTYTYSLMTYVPRHNLLP